MLHIYYKQVKTLPETFYNKNSDFCTKNDVSFKKNHKTQKKRLEVGFFRRGFLGFVGRVFLGGFFIANPISYNLLQFLLNYSFTV
jgi:hypothetical protein